MNAHARVVLGLAPADEEAIEDALYASRELRVLASGSDARELVELAAASSPDLVLVSAGLPGLDARSLARLRALGARLAGLALDDHAAAALERLDLDEIVRTPMQAGRLLELLAARPREQRHERPSPEPARPRSRPAREGSVVAVLGSKGAPGSSELAASFAALVARKHRVLLTEFDADGGRLALRLGVDPHQGSLLGLIRALAAGEPDAAALLPHWIHAGARGWPAVLPGLPDPHRDLAELPLPGLGGRLLDLLCSSFPLVVCDLGHRLSPGGERDLAVRLHREAALAADALVTVLGARPEQLHAGLAQLDLLLDGLGVPAEALRVVVNGQPGVRAPREGADAAAITRELAERGLAVDAWLPYDRRALHAAARRRLPLAVASRRGPYARGLGALVAQILLPSLPRPAARKRRLRPLAGAGAPRVGQTEEVALPWKA